MATVCAICGKKAMRGNFVSHSKQRTKRLFKPNLHSYRMSVDGLVRRVKLCTTCLRTEKKHLREMTAKTVARINADEVKKPRIVITREEKKHEVIPEEVKLEMKEKSLKDKEKTGDMELIDEIMSESLQKDKKKAK